MIAHIESHSASGAEKADSLPKNKECTSEMAFCKAFLRDVALTEPKTYTHIELAAGNYSFNRDGTLNTLPFEGVRPIHDAECVCVGCDYEENRYRYNVLEKTIADVIKKHSDKHIKFYINDMDALSNYQATKHARTHAQNNASNTDIDFIELPGDCFELNIEQYNPDSVHLKNPENIFSSAGRGKMPQKLHFRLIDS